MTSRPCGSGLEPGKLLLHIVEASDVRARRRRGGEELLLRRLKLGLDRVEHREVAVDHRVHQRVEDIARAVAEQLRLALAARAYLLEAALGGMAHRKDVVGGGEDVDLAELQV